jgi:LysM repeat protein
MANTYKVVKGDTLSEIAQDAGVSLKTIIKLNPQINNPNLIFPGQVITLAKPTPAAPKPAPAGGNDAQNAARLAAEEAARQAALKAAEDAAQASGLAAMDAGSKLEQESAAKIAEDAAAKAAADATAAATAAKTQAEAQAKLDEAMKAALLAKDAETAAALAKANEEVRLAKEEAAAAALAKAESEAANAKTAEELAAALAAIEAANAQIAATSAASAEAVAAAQANINQSGDIAIPESSLSDTAAAMYAKELAIKEANDTALAKRQSIMEIVNERFASYNLGTLATKIRELAIGGANEATITLALQQTDEYKQRFKANDTRMEKGLRVLSPSEYLTAEDSYRQVLRTYGLTQFDNDEYVSQFVANDTSATEINNRISTAVTRIQNADPQITKTLKEFYGLGDADLVAYVLDTKNQLPEVMKKVTAAEIGTAAMKQGLAGNVLTSEALAAQGIDQAQAQATYSKIAEVLPTAEKLSEIYGSTLEGYDQTKAEKEYFGQMASAKRARESLKAREIATFSGESGLTKGSLGSSTKGQY